MRRELLPTAWCEDLHLPESARVRSFKKHIHTHLTSQILQCRKPQGKKNTAAPPPAFRMKPYEAPIMPLPALALGQIHSDAALTFTPLPPPTQRSWYVTVARLAVCLTTACFSGFCILRPGKPLGGYMRMSLKLGSHSAFAGSSNHTP